jgi:hypothetical protein
MEVGDDGSASTNNNSTPILELLGKGKMKAYTKASGTTMGLNEDLGKKPASIPSATVANKENHISSTRTTSRSKSAPTSSKNKARGTTGTASRSKSTPILATKMSGSTIEKPIATGTGSRGKSTPKSSSGKSGKTTGSTTEKAKATGTGRMSTSTPKSSTTKAGITNSPQKRLTGSSERAAQTSVQETPPQQKKPVTVAVRLGDKEATPVKCSGISTSSEESQSRDT